MNFPAVQKIADANIKSLRLRPTLPVIPALHLRIVWIETGLQTLGDQGGSGGDGLTLKRLFRHMSE